MAEVILDRAGIEARIPHGAPMCLLDQVRYCGQNGIECRAHLAAPHPLMREGRWPSTTAIEFAAQAMALHGALIAGTLRDSPAEKSTAENGTATAHGTSTAHGTVAANGIGSADRLEGSDGPASAGGVAQTPAAASERACRTENASDATLRAPRGFIAGLRSVRMEGQFFPVGLYELHVEAERVSGDDVQVMYEFSVRGVAPEPCELASGRAIVVLDAGRFGSAGRNRGSVSGVRAGAEGAGNADATNTAALTSTAQASDSVSSAATSVAALQRHAVMPTPDRLTAHRRDAIA